MSTLPTRRNERIPIKRSYACSSVDGSETPSSESETEWEPPKIESEEDTIEGNELEYDHDVLGEDPLVLSSSLDESKIRISKKGVKGSTKKAGKSVGRKNATRKVEVEAEGNTESSQARLVSTSASGKFDPPAAPGRDEELLSEKDWKRTKRRKKSDVQNNAQEAQSSSNAIQEEWRKRKREYDRMRYQNMTDEERERRVARRKLRRVKRRLAEIGDKDTDDENAFDSSLEMESEDECGNGQDEKPKPGTSTLTDEQREQKRERERLRYHNMSEEDRARRLERNRLRRQRRKLGIICDDVDKKDDKKTDEETGAAKSRKRTAEQLRRKREQERIRYRNMTEEQRLKRLEAQRQRRLHMTPEEKEAQRLRRLKMTPEEIAQDEEELKFQRRMQWYLYRHAKLATMTEEERKQEQRDIYLSRYTKKVLNETPEQRQERLEQQREKYRQKRLNMTPEQQYRHRNLVRKWVAKNTKLKKYSEMSEEEKEKMRAFQRERIKRETPEQRERRLARYKRNTERRRILNQMQEDEGMSKEEADKELRISRPDLYPDPAQTGVKKGRKLLSPGTPYEYKPRAPNKSAPGRKPTVTQEELEAYFAKLEQKKNPNQPDSQENEPSIEETEIISDFTSYELPEPQPSYSTTIVSSNDVSACPFIENSEATSTIENIDLQTASDNVYIINTFTLSHHIPDYQAGDTNGFEISQNQNTIEFNLEFTTVDPQSTILLVPEGTDVSNIFLEAVDTDITSPVASPFGEHHPVGDDDSQSLHSEVKSFDANEVSNDLQTEVDLPSESITNINENKGEESKSVQDKGKEVTSKVKTRKRKRVSRGVNDESEPSEYCCDVCGKVFKNKIYFNEHMEARHSEERKIFQCPHNGCDKEFQLPVYVLRHFLQVHTSDSRLRKRNNIASGTTEAQDKPAETEATVCPYCGKCLNCATSVARHIYNIHEYNPEKAAGFMCQYCSRTFKAKGTLDDHIRRIHLGMDNKCDMCGRTFQSPMKLWKHKVDAHDMKDLDPSTISSKINVVECEHCGIKLFRGMKTHIQNEHPEHFESYKKNYKKKHTVSREMRLGYEMKRRNNPHVCHKCNKSFTRTYGYRIHMQKFHILPLAADGNSPFQCEKCQKTLISEKELVKHILAKHARLSNIKIYWVADDDDEKLKFCQFCQAPQVNNHLYKVHLYDKHTEDILNSFKKGIDKEKRMEEKQGLTIHTCPYCDTIKKTTDVGMVSHIRQKHPGESYEMYMNKQPKAKSNTKDATSTKASRRIKAVKKDVLVEETREEEQGDLDINERPSRKSSRVRTPSRRYRNEAISDVENVSRKRRRKGKIQFEKLLVPSAPAELTLDDKKLFEKFQYIKWHKPVVLLQKLKDVELPKSKIRQ